MRTASSDWEHICLQAEIVVARFRRCFSPQILKAYSDDIEIVNRTCWLCDADGHRLNEEGQRADEEGGGWPEFAPSPTTVEAWRDLTKALSNLASLLGGGR